MASAVASSTTNMRSQVGTVTAKKEKGLEIRARSGTEASSGPRPLLSSPRPEVRSQLCPACSPPRRPYPQPLKSTGESVLFPPAQYGQLLLSRELGMGH